MRRSFGFCFVLMGIPSVAMGTERETGVGIVAGVAFHKVKVKRTEQVSVDVEELVEELDEELRELEEKLAGMQHLEILREFMQTVLDSGMAYIEYKSLRERTFRVVGATIEVDGQVAIQQIAGILREKYDGWRKQKKQIALRYHPDKQPDPEKRKEAQEVFQRYMSALTLYENKLKMPFQEAVQTGSDKVVLDVMDFTDEEKSILAEYYGMNIRNIWGNDAGAAREKYFDVIRRGSALAQKFCRLVNGNEGLKMQMYSLLKAVSGCYSITDDYIGAPRFDEEGGYTERQFADAKNQMERLWGHHFDEERILLERLESLMKQQAEKQAELAPKELKVSKKCAKPIIELEGCREYHRGKFVFGAKVTLGTTFGKVKYCNDAYVAMAPMLGVKVGQRLVLYGLGGFMFQRIVSPLVGVGIKFNLSDRFYARLEGNRWSNKKVRANVIKVGFGWRL